MARVTRDLSSHFPTDVARLIASYVDMVECFLIGYINRMDVNPMFIGVPGSAEYDSLRATFNGRQYADNYGYLVEMLNGMHNPSRPYDQILIDAMAKKLA
jgi:hypothetical protein